MERLTIDEIIEHCDRKTKMYEKARDIKHLETTMNNSTKEYWEHKQVAEYLRKFKDYRYLEEQGRLVKLPCKVGDTVYEIAGATTHGYGYGWKCLTYEKAYVHETVFNLGRLNDIGKTVFLTESAAEAKLKELRGEQNGKI